MVIGVITSAMRRLVFVLAFLALSGVVRAEIGFLAGVEDLPLMEGLVESPGSGTTFETPGGRIVEAFARGSVSADEVRQFYRITLPQLGWVAAGGTSFRREGERLGIEIVGTQPQLSVRFILAPE